MKTENALVAVITHWQPEEQLHLTEFENCQHITTRMSLSEMGEPIQICLYQVIRSDHAQKENEAFVYSGSLPRSEM